MSLGRRSSPHAIAFTVIVIATVGLLLASYVKPLAVLFGTAVFAGQEGVVPSSVYNMTKFGTLELALLSVMIVWPDPKTVIDGVAA
jgi:hypothetical protein